MASLTTGIDTERSGVDYLLRWPAKLLKCPLDLTVVAGKITEVVLCLRRLLSLLGTRLV